MKLPFAERKASTAFMTEAKKIMIQEMDRRRSRYVPTTNVQGLSHGRSWVFQQDGREGYHTQTTHLQRQQHNVSIRMDRLKANEVSVLPEFILGLAEQMEENLAATIRKEIETIAGETGNIVSLANSGSLPKAYLDLLKKTSGSITAAGKFSPPQFLFDPGLVERLDEEMKQQSDEFHQEVEEAMRKVENAANQAEKERLEKFDFGE